MKSILNPTFNLGFLVLNLLFSFVAEKSWPKTTPQTKIQVTLLGQGCILQGPFNENTLQAVHLVGPAQIYPNLSSPDSPEALEQTRKALTQIKTMNYLPSLLDRYKEKLAKRLEAQTDFLNNLQAAKKNQDYSFLLKTGKTYFKDQDLKSFEEFTQKLQIPEKKPGQNRAVIEQIFDFFNHSIEQDPEEEFHRAIKKLKIEYICSFEEIED